MDFYGKSEGRGPDLEVNRSIANPQTPINTEFKGNRKTEKVPDYNFTTTFFGAIGSNKAQ